MAKNWTIQKVSWQTHQSALKAVREVVFVQEQQVPLHIEWDDEDATAQHLLCLNDDNQAIGCARLLQKNGVGKIGRMAVLAQHRGLGIGMALLTKAIALHTEQGMQKIQLSAQTHAIPFYLRAGFVAISVQYQDANIPHVDMLYAP